LRAESGSDAGAALVQRTGREVALVHGGPGATAAVPAELVARTVWGECCCAGVRWRGWRSPSGSRPRVTRPWWS
jgi:hypothetical protein